MIPTLESITQELNLRFPPAMPVTPEPAPATEGGTAGAPAAVSMPAPVQTTDFAVRGYHLDCSLPASDLVAAAELLDGNGFAIDTVTGVDWIKQNEMEVVYDFYHPLCDLRVVVRVRVPRREPAVPTISGVFPGANWHERETHDFFGIRFEGHPDLTPLLLPEDATYHPLLKDFTGESAQ